MKRRRQTTALVSFGCQPALKNNRYDAKRAPTRHPNFPNKLRLLCITTIASAIFCQHATAGEVWVTTGVSGNLDALYTYDGLIYSPLAKLSQTGPIVKLFTRGGYFKYDTHLPDRDLNPVKAEIDVYAYGGDAQLGYQFAFANGRIMLAAGISLREYNLSPHDPGSNLNGLHLGAIFSGDGEYRLPTIFDGNFGLMGNFEYMTKPEKLWLQAKPFYSFQNGLKSGPEFAYVDGKDYEKIRTGVFFSGLELPWQPSFARIYVGGEAGAEIDLRDGGSEAYGGLNIGLLF